MDSFILGIKKEQSQTFDDTGARIPITFIHTYPNILLDIKNKTNSGYNAVVLGFKEGKSISKPVLGLLKKKGIDKKLQYLHEFRLRNKGQIESVKEEQNTVVFRDSEIKVGEEVKPPIVFKKGDIVLVTSKSKGKGFQGVVKRHAFKGGPKTHGQSDRQRAPGAIGMTTTPGRVFKGKRMAGRMGGETITVKNVKVVEVTDQGIYVMGLIPGSKGELVRIQYITKAL